jgi:hypothetical protein
MDLIPDRVSNIAPGSVELTGGVSDMFCVVRAVLPLTNRTALALQRCLASNATEKCFTEEQRISDFLEQRKQLVACNIKMNVGGDEGHAPVLAELIVMAQEFFAKREPKTLPHPLPADDFEQTGIYKTIDFTCVGALVDVHMDPDSNRSSLHLAGPVEHLVEITNELILSAVTEFRKRKRGCKLNPEAKTQKALSKVIDIIDNVTFLPLVPGTNGDICARRKIYSPTWVPTYPSWGARQVGNFMKETAGIHVFFHHIAHRRNLSLSNIAEQRIAHFRGNTTLREAAYVGAYKDFVEDFHIILSSSCNRRRVLNLAEVLNSYGYGLSGIEATVEQYNKDLWDVHCRLLRPHITGSSSGEVELAAQRWKNLQPVSVDQKSDWILKFIRVGANYNQCLKILEDISLSDEKREEHDASVMQSFRICCSQHYPAISANAFVE